MKYFSAAVVVAHLFMFYYCPMNKIGLLLTIGNVVCWSIIFGKELGEKNGKV